jgi:hypothetical protein
MPPLRRPAVLSAEHQPWLILSQNLQTVGETVTGASFQYPGTLLRQGRYDRLAMASVVLSPLPERVTLYAGYSELSMLLGAQY